MKVKVESISGASGYNQKVTEAPASITIITADDIQRYGYRTLADILRNVRGFYVTYDRNYSYLGVRGFGRPGDYNSRVLVLVDGHRINDDIYGQALIGTEFPVDVDLIDRIEVIRGPNSSLYLADAFLGVINIITKTSQRARHITASGELASFGTFKSRLTYGNKFSNGLQVLLSGTYYDSHGHNQLFFPEFDSPATNNGIAQNADGDRARQLFASVSYGNFTIHGVYGSRDKQIPTASFDTVFDDSETQTVDAQGWIDVRYDRRLGSDWGLVTRVYYDHYTYDGTYANPPNSGGSAVVINKDLGWGQWWGANLLLSRKLAGRDTVTFGAEYQDNFKQEQENYDIQPYTLYMDSRPTSSIESLYAQGEFPIRSDLTVNLGLRYDHYSTFGNTVNPRAALIYSPFEKTTVKLLYGQSFRPPNVYELYYSVGDLEPNPHLKPETVKSTELVLEQYLPKSLQLSVSVFDDPIHGLISAEPGATPVDTIYRNSQQVSLKGADAELDWKSRRGFEAGIGLSLQDLKLAGNGPPLTNSPDKLGVAHLSVPLFNGKLLASVNAQYVSRRRTLAGNYAGAYVIPDFTLISRGAKRSWDFSASVYNVFNSAYADPGGVGLQQDLIYQDGRNFRVKFTYRF